MHIFNDRAIFSLPRFPRLMLACNADMNLCGKIIESYEQKRFYFEKYIYINIIRNGYRYDYTVINSIKIKYPVRWNIESRVQPFSWSQRLKVSYDVRVLMWSLDWKPNYDWARNDHLVIPRVKDPKKNQENNIIQSRRK